MKRLVEIAVCLASGLVLNAGARADDGGLLNNPYAPIVVRNVFALNPPQPVDPATPADPPPKITLNGIISIFNHQLQVLFKVAPKAGQPGAKEESYILSVGQRQDEIEVIQIDEKGGLVTFNNHGTVQELPLVKANVTAVNTIVAPPGRSGPTPNLTAPNGENSGKVPIRFGGRPAGGPGAARNRATGGGNNNPVNNNPGSSVPQGSYSGQQQPQNTMTREEQVLIIEANRLATQDLVNQGKLPPLPPTVLTPSDATGPGGAPLTGMPPMPP
jgi:hypothetical protein